MKSSSNLIRILVLLLFMSLFSNIQSKNVYVPRYKATLNLYDLEGKSEFFESSSSELSCNILDGKVTFTVLHEQVDKSISRSIKAAKAAIILSSFAYGFSTGSMAVNSLQTPADYTKYRVASTGRELSGSIFDASVTAMNSLFDLSITLLIENDSDNELSCNDMNRGLTWYVLPHSSIVLNFSNPGLATYRFAYSHPVCDQIHYLVVNAESELNKESAVFETEDAWIFPIYEIITKEVTPPGGYSPTVVEEKKKIGYKLVQRNTYEEVSMTEEEVKLYKKEHKAKPESKEKATDSDEEEDLLD